MTTPPSQEAHPAFPAQVRILVHLEAQKYDYESLRFPRKSIPVSYKHHKKRLRKSCGFIVAVMGDSNQCELLTLG